MLVDRSNCARARTLRAEILEKTREYFHAAYHERPFLPDSDPVPVSAAFSTNGKSSSWSIVR